MKKLNKFYKITLVEENSWGRGKFSLVVHAIHIESSSVIAEAVFAWDKGLSAVRPGSVSVLEEFRRKGIATELYKFTEEYTGLKLKPSLDQSSDAQHFWNYYSKL